MEDFGKSLGVESLKVDDKYNQATAAMVIFRSNEGV
jgi:hypothetical protein